MQKLKTFFVWIGLLVVIAGLMILKNRPQERIEFSEFLQMVSLGAVESANVWGNAVEIRTRQGQTLNTLGTIDDDIRIRLSEAGVLLTENQPRSTFNDIVTWLLPVLLVLAVLFWLLKRNQGGVGNVLNMLKSQHREIAGEEVRVRFADVGGCEEAKAQLRDLVDFLNDPQPWADVGARLPRGVLLEGPPGCGKTLLGRAVAGETKAKFFLVTGSEFVEMFVGVGAARVRDLFDTAAKSAPAVIFLDEIDAIGRRRGSGLGGSHDEREQTLNQLLVSLDGFRPLDRVVVIAATNRVDVLDQALLRPGRFDRRIRVPSLSVESRQQVLDIHTRKKRLAADVSLAEIARQTEGYSGAQLENLVNEGALTAVRRSLSLHEERAEITQTDLRGALQAVAERQERFDQVDALLIESATQLSEPTAAARVRIALKDADPIEGEVLWADSSFLKLRRPNGDGTVLIPKHQVLHIETLAGTATAEGVAIDRWAGRRSDVL